MKSKINLRYWKIILVLFITGFTIRLFPIDTSYFFWDEAVYLLNAKWFAFGYSEYNEIDYRPPLVPLILSLFFRVGNFEVVSRIVVSFINSLSIPVIYFLGKQINEKVGILSALILTLFPFHILSSRWIMTDGINMLLISLSVLLFLKDKVFFSGISAGLSFITKYTSIIFIPLLLISMCIYSRNKLKNVIFFFIGGFIIVLPHLLFNYFYHNSFIGFIFKAIDAIAKTESVSFKFITWLFYDLFGPLLVFLFFYSLYQFLFDIFNKKIEKFKIFIFYWFISFFIINIWILNQGVDKPPSILWMDERFLLPLIPPFLIIVSEVISKIKSRKIIFCVMVSFLIFSFSKYSLVYTRNIEFENGLRNVTKFISIYIRENTDENDIIYCTFNCPPIAWYSERRIKLLEFWNETSWNDLDVKTYLVKFSNKNPSLEKCFNEGFRLIKKIEDEEWTVYLLQKHKDITK